ncbi:NAD(P)/FAD-dependent oxidoreductase [Thalassovita taeanensis]|uniref:Glycine/D-amino acid oxidase n=1 Tax=Thalassovita taeanensis TaxID=657014 RepID=A0A1H9CDC9_9RHOB|nr:FAD-binding oxidoreductase [Thalassovita taeanensis]SEP98678.1 Glycine/D-amino acid oxidase [Thalassovita taeanensis]
MKHIFPAHAYGPAPLDTCHWSQAVPDTLLDRPALEGDHSTDVLIIGAGFTGLSAALHLAQDGVAVTVIDSEFPGWGASGRNGGFCCLGGTKASDSTLNRRFGPSGAQGWHQAERAAVTLVGDLLTQHGIDADTHSQGETILAHNARAMRDLRAHADQITTSYGAAPTLHSQSDLPGLGLAGPFHGGMTIPIGFGLHPRKYLSGLLSAAEAAGARIHGHSPAQHIAQGAPHTVTTPTATIRAKRLIFATNGYSSEDTPPWLAARYMPAQSNVLVTRPLTPTELDAAGWTSRQMAYDTRNLLHYFRLMPDNRFLFGMRGGLQSSPASDVALKQLTRQHFDRMFPAWRHVETPANWSGMVCFTASLVPHCGPVPGMQNSFAGFAYHGNGVAMGTYTGALLADLVQGKPPRHPYPAALQTPAPRFPLGRLRRAVMGPAYALKALQDL